jgi:hypothetical protein
VFDLKPDLFTARVPGRDEPFRAMSLCGLMNKVERRSAEQTAAALLFGAGASQRQGRTDDRLPVLVQLRHRRPLTGSTANVTSTPAITSGT